MKMNALKTEMKDAIIDAIIIVPIFLLLIYLLGDFFVDNRTFSIIVFVLFFINYIIVLLHERKYDKNFPYKPYKSKESIVKRGLIGLWAGVHYLFSIGT